MIKFNFIEMYDDYEKYCEINKKEKGLRSFKIFVEKYNNIDDNISNIMTNKKDIIDIYDIMIEEYKKFFKDIIDTKVIFIGNNKNKQNEFYKKMLNSLDNIK